MNFDPIFLGLKATDLKRSFFGKPNPYVKISILPRVRHLAASQMHHGQQIKTNTLQNTIEPNWEKEVRVYLAQCLDYRSLFV